MTLWSNIPLAVKILVPGVAAIAAVTLLKPKPVFNEILPEEPTAPTVSVIYVNPITQNIPVKAQGTVEPRREIDLVSEVTGTIIHVDTQFVNGGAFEQQQLLIKIDDQDYQIALVRAEATLANAEKALAKEKGLTRQAKREWRDVGNAEANSLFLREPQIKAAKAEVAAAKADVAKAELNLKRTQISVPFSGRIREALVDLGQYVSSGTKLARVYDTSVAQIRLPLTDKDIGLLNLLEIDSSQHVKTPVSIKGKIGGQNLTWDGQLARTEASLDTRSRMYYVVVEVSDPYQQKTLPLMVGMFVEATLMGKAIENVIELPREAIFQLNQLYYITDDNKVALEKVTVLNRTSDKVWIISEMLSRNTPIVANNQIYISPGIDVRLVDQVLDPPQAVAELARCE